MIGTKIDLQKIKPLPLAKRNTLGEDYESD